MTASTKTFYVFDGDIDEVLKLGKAAVAKLGSEFSLSVSPYTEFLTCGHVYSNFRYANEQATSGKIARKITIVRAVTVALPDLAGYKLLAKIEAIGNRNLVFRIDGDALYNTEAFATAELSCAHCGTKRARKCTYLVQREADGALLQIGSACAGEYFGSPALAKMIERLSEFVEQFAARQKTDEDTSDMEEAGSSIPRIAGVKYLAELSAAFIRIHGFIGAVKASNLGCSSTKDLIIASIADRLPFPAPEITDYDRKLATETIAYCSALECLSDFDCNVKSVCMAEYIRMNTLSFLVAAVNSYKMRYEASTSTSHLGTIGDSIIVQVSVVGIYKSYVKMDDGAGHCLTWHTTVKSIAKLGIVVGWKGTIKATIKGHSEFRGSKQTDIGGVKVV